MHPIINIFISLFAAYATILIIVGILTLWGYSRQDFTNWFTIFLMWLAGIGVFVITFMNNAGVD